MKPTETQKQWLAGVVGPEVWGELLAHEGFRAALESSIERSHQMALRYAHARERVVPMPSDLRLWAA
ncbi:MAG TPA: hypothetical protein VGH19_20785 [Verrucomicrobiae bacterium]